MSRSSCQLVSVVERVKASEPETARNTQCLIVGGAADEVSVPSQPPVSEFHSKYRAENAFPL